MTTTVVTTLRLGADLYSSVSVYDDQAPIWGFTSGQVGHRTGMSLRVDSDITDPALLDRLADTVEADSRAFVLGLRQHAERLRKDQQ